MTRRTDVHLLSAPGRRPRSLWRSLAQDRGHRRRMVYRVVSSDGHSGRHDSHGVARTQREMGPEDRAQQVQLPVRLQVRPGPHCARCRVRVVSGTWLRRREDKPKRHRCHPPRSEETGAPDGDKGDIWRCDVRVGWHSDETPRYCGKRWIIRWGTDGPYWYRRYWPWPRSTVEEQIERSA